MSAVKKILGSLVLVGFMSSASASIISFDIANMSDYGNPSQSVSGTTTVSPDGSTVELSGNTWASYAIDSFVVDANTIFNFYFTTSDIGEINGIGFDNDNLLSPNTTFQLAGTQVFGLQSFNSMRTLNTTYSFSIKLSDYFMGTFDRLVFVADSDAANTSANSKFSNVEITSNLVAQVSTPATLAFFVVGLGGLLARRFK